jgi:hypothetical protein
MPAVLLVEDVRSMGLPERARAGADGRVMVTES